MKATLLVDTASNAILDIHVTTTRKHDTQIGPFLEKRNAGSIAVLAGDKGDDDQNLRQLAREDDIRPLIKHREFIPLHKAWNARLDSDLYHQRNMSESVNAAIKQKFGAFVRSRVWWKQFRVGCQECQKVGVGDEPHHEHTALGIDAVRTARGEMDCVPVVTRLAETVGSVVVRTDIN